MWVAPCRLLAAALGAPPVRPAPPTQPNPAVEILAFLPGPPLPLPGSALLRPTCSLFTRVRNSWFKERGGEPSALPCRHLAPASIRLPGAVPSPAPHMTGSVWAAGGGAGGGGQCGNLASCSRYLSSKIAPRPSCRAAWPCEREGEQHARQCLGCGLCSPPWLALRPFWRVQRLLRRPAQVRPSSRHNFGSPCLPRRLRAVRRLSGQGQSICDERRSKRWSAAVLPATPPPLAARRRPCTDRRHFGPRPSPAALCPCTDRRHLRPWTSPAALRLPTVQQHGRPRETSTWRTRAPAPWTGQPWRLW